MPRVLDQRPSVQNMRLVFSSARHGRSLSALYEMVAGRAPCVLLVRFVALVNVSCLPAIDVTKGKTGQAPLTATVIAIVTVKI